MIVVDASAALSALLNAGPARRARASEQLHAPHLIDSEVANGLRRRVAAQDLGAAAGVDRSRHHAKARDDPVPGVLDSSILDRGWELGDNLSASDASYVALAELLDCNLLTVDARPGRAPGIRCPVTVDARPGRAPGIRCPFTVVPG